MTQAQDAGVLADKKPSAIVVGVGAEQGLGAALCRRFAAQGYHVFVAGRTSGKIDEGCAHDRWRRWQRRGDRDGYDERG